MNNVFGVYVIRDHGSGDSSLPFFAHTSNVAVRQFANSLRTLPPSCRADFELCAIGSYDSSSFELKDDMSVASVVFGDDDNILKMIEQDSKFFGRVSIDQLSVVSGGNANE